VVVVVVVRGAWCVDDDGVHACMRGWWHNGNDVGGETPGEMRWCFLAFAGEAE